nr:DUF1385 domain-containing protein [bacterium]
MPNKSKAPRACGVGGQALIEGVMMRSRERMAWSVRKPNGEIVTESQAVTPAHGVAAWPFIRGLTSLASGLGGGYKALMRSAEICLDEEEAPKAVDKPPRKFLGLDGEGWAMAGSVVVAIALALGLFIALPALAGHGLNALHLNKWWVALGEGLVRMIVFVLYLVCISRMKDIRRTFQYHGAEHKTIHCVESGQELSVANARGGSRLHPRCGTSFLLLVMIVSWVLYALLGKGDTLWWRMLSRILLLPVVAMVAYELQRLLANHDNLLCRILRAPGLWLQALTAFEPDDDMLEVAITAYRAAAGLPYEHTPMPLAEQAAPAPEGPAPQPQSPQDMPAPQPPVQAVPDGAGADLPAPQAEETA